MKMMSCMIQMSMELDVIIIAATVLRLWHREVQYHRTALCPQAM